MGPWPRKGPCAATQPANRLTLQKLTDPLRHAAAKTFDATETRNGAIFAGETFLFYKTEHSKNKAVRWLGCGYITFTVAQHVRYRVCDAGINAQGVARNCSTF